MTKKFKAISNDTGEKAIAIKLGLSIVSIY